MQAKSVEQPSGWAYCIHETIHAYNSRPHQSLGVDCPGAVFFQRPWKTIPDVLHNSSPCAQADVAVVDNAASTAQAAMAHTPPPQEA